MKLWLMGVVVLATLSSSFAAEKDAEASKKSAVDLEAENTRLARSGGASYGEGFQGEHFEVDRKGFGGQRFVEASSSGNGGYSGDGVILNGGHSGGSYGGGGHRQIISGGGGHGGGYGGGHGGHGGHGGGGFSHGGGGHHVESYYVKPAIVQVPIKIPIPIHIPKHKHLHHHHKHVHVTPVTNHHKHVKVYPLYQNHKHISVHPTKTKVVKVTKPILVKPVITPIYKPVVKEYGHVTHHNYGLQGRYAGKVKTLHTDGGSYGGLAGVKHQQGGSYHVDQGTTYAGGHGAAAPQVKVGAPHVNQGTSYVGGGSSSAASHDAPATYGKGH